MGVQLNPVGADELRVGPLVAGASGREEILLARGGSLAGAAGTSAAVRAGAAAAAVAARLADVGAVSVGQVQA
jgi:hypothetical protein